MEHKVQLACSLGAGRPVDIMEEGPHALYFSVSISTTKSAHTSCKVSFKLEEMTKEDYMTELDEIIQLDSKTKLDRWLSWILLHAATELCVEIEFIQK